MHLTRSEFAVDCQQIFARRPNGGSVSNGSVNSPLLPSRLPPNGGKQTPMAADTVTDLLSAAVNAKSGDLPQQRLITRILIGRAH